MPDQRPSHIEVARAAAIEVGYTVRNHDAKDPIKRGTAFSIDALGIAVTNINGDLHIYTEGFASTVISLVILNANLSRTAIVATLVTHMKLAEALLLQLQQWKGGDPS